MGDTQEAKSRLERAHEYEEAASLVPAVKGFKYFRAGCYRRAGVDANRAAALTAGTNGFLVTKERPAPAADAALRYWRDFKTNNDRDMTGETLHQYALALAYDHKLDDAYALLRLNERFYPPEPGFYYDAARIDAAAGAEFRTWSPAKAKEYTTKFRFPTAPGFVFRTARGLAPEALQESSQALERAVWLGFKDFDKANNAPDLQPFREAAPADLGFFRTYAQIVGPR